jgi:hypothetical protein
VIFKAVLCKAISKSGINGKSCKKRIQTNFRLLVKYLISHVCEFLALTFDDYKVLLMLCNICAANLKKHKKQTLLLPLLLSGYAFTKTETV